MTPMRLTYNKAGTIRDEAYGVKLGLIGLIEPISRLLSAAVGCKARGTALSAKTVLDVLQYASEPFLPSALPTDFSLDLASKSVLK